MYSIVWLILLILVQVEVSPRRVREKLLQCYSCRDNNCQNNNHDHGTILCKDFGSTLCFTDTEHVGSDLLVTEKGCTDVLVKGEQGVILPRQNITRIDEYKKQGYQLATGYEIAMFLRTNDSCALKPKGKCYCRSDLCNHRDQQGTRREPLRCYSCSDFSCRRFQSNPKKYVKICEDRESTFCWTDSKKNGRNYVITRRGCADLLERNGTFVTVAQEPNTDNYSEEGYKLATRNAMDQHVPEKCDGSNKYGCECRSNLCNSKMLNENNGTIAIERAKKKCYRCTNDSEESSCSGFRRNSSYVVECDGNATFCFTIMELEEGFAWTVKERGCAGLVKDNNRLAVRPIGNGQKFVKDFYDDDTRYSRRVENSLIEACKLDLCNGEI